jgi:acyl-coenzyme A synthetase/AMP-(fatty) acid ligase
MSLASNLIEQIQQTALRNPAAPAFVQGNQILSYGQFYASLCVAAKKLHECGIGEGDVVGLTMDQSPLHGVAMLALARLGAMFVSIAPALSNSDKADLARKYDVKTIISLWDGCSIEGLGFIKLDAISVAGDERNLDFIDYWPQAATPLQIILTSGTTGERKGILYTHGDMLDRIERTLYDCGADTRLIPSDLHLPLGSVFVIGVLCTGGTLVMPNAADLPDLAKAINLYGVTHTLFSPQVALRLDDLLKEEGIAFPSLKHLRILGDTPTKKLLRAIRTKFTPNVYVPYGLTEIGIVSMATPETLATWPDSAGKIQPWIKLEIVDGEGRVLPAGEKGEIRLKIERMPKAYYCDEENSGLRFHDGWFYPGDLGHVSVEGMLYIDGRVDDIINHQGIKVSPILIEKELSKHPSIREAVVFQMEVDAGEKVLAAAIIVQGNSAPPNLAGYCKQHLHTLAPEKFFIMSDFPRTLGGKPLRREVPALAQRMIQGKHGIPAAADGTTG